MQGRSRSATIILAYLMSSKKYPLKKAMELTQKQRPIVKPNHFFFEKLKEFELMLNV